MKDDNHSHKNYSMSWSRYKDSTLTQLVSNCGCVTPPNQADDHPPLFYRFCSSFPCFLDLDLLYRHHEMIEPLALFAAQLGQAGVGYALPESGSVKRVVVA
jgi:hypothetical protein